MYDRLVGGATTFDSHRQSVDDESSIGTGVDRPAHCHLRTGVEHDTAKDLALSRLAFQWSSQHFGFIATLEVNLGAPLACPN